MHRIKLLLFIAAALFLFPSGARAGERALPRLLDLGADKCVPCKKMAPILTGLKSEYAGRLDVVFIDVWKTENRAEAQKYGISAIPTQIFFGRDGTELWRHTGYISKADILAKWLELGYGFDGDGQG